MLRPTNPSEAGSNVTAASTATITAEEVPSANPFKNDSPISSIPSNEIITVTPANTTARPAVSIASIVAANGSPVRRSASR